MNNCWVDILKNAKENGATKEEYATLIDAMIISEKYSSDKLDAKNLINEIFGTGFGGHTCIDKKEPNSNIAYRTYCDADTPYYRFVFKTEKEAINILKDMKSLADEYGYIAFADYCDMCAHDRNYDFDNGWDIKDLASSEIYPLWDGYIIDLPVPHYVRRHTADEKE